MNKKCTAQSLLTKKINHEKISMLTSYDYSMAKIVDQAGIDVILVGDSLGMVIQGHDSTLPVSVNDMVYHCRCVSKGIKHALLVGDLPFLSYHISTEEAVRNAGKIIQEGRATAVKLEGGKNVADCIQAITRAQIPVMGHIGLTPQSVNVFGGFKVQGKSTEAAKALIEDALAVENAGAFAIVLECVPEELSQYITQKLSIPTIGIGAGRYCDGQVLVVDDMLGMYSDFTPKFVKKYANLNETITNAISEYIQDVQAGNFPEKKNVFTAQNLGEVLK